MDQQAACRARTIAELRTTVELLVKRVDALEQDLRQQQHVFCSALPLGLQIGSGQPIYTATCSTGVFK